ncbi:TPA: hypothetical protein ACXYK5_003087 [Legionella pneumophila]
MTKLINLRGIMQSAMERFKGLRLKITERANEVKLNIEEHRIEEGRNIPLHEALFLLRGQLDTIAQGRKRDVVGMTNLLAETLLRRKDLIISQNQVDEPQPLTQEELNLSYVFFAFEKLVQFLVEFLMQDTTLQKLALNQCLMSATSAPHLAQLIQTHPSLVTLELASNDLGDEGVRVLAAVLTHNPRLRHLNLNHNQITKNGIKYLARALLTNSHLTHLHLEQNAVGALGMEYLSIALRANYTLVELTLDEDDEQIATYLQRNQQLAQVLAPLNDALDKGLILTHSAQIASCLEHIERLVPNRSELADDSQPQEAYRVLTALGHHISGDAEAAIHALLPAFTNPSFQDAAHQVLGFLFGSDVIRPQLHEMGLSRDGLLYSLYTLEKCSPAPEIKTNAYMALYRCLYEAQVYTIKEKYTFERENPLLTESELRQLLQEAACSEFTKGNRERALVLYEVSKRTANFSLLTKICSVPAFKNVLKSRYPYARNITTPAYCLWAAATQIPLMVSIAARSNAPVLEPGPTIEDLVRPIKKRLAHIVPQELRAPEPRAENAPNIEPTLSSSDEINNDFETLELRDERLDALKRFRERYEQRFAFDRANCCFGFFRRSRLNLTETSSLNDIFDHALKNQGHRTRSVLQELEWLDADGQIEASIRVLIDYEDQEPKQVNLAPAGN